MNCVEVKGLLLESPPKAFMVSKVVVWSWHSMSLKRVVAQGVHCLQRCLLAVVGKAQPKGCSARLCFTDRLVIPLSMVAGGKRDGRDVQPVFVHGQLVDPQAIIFIV